MRESKRAAAVLLAAVLCLGSTGMATAADQNQNAADTVAVAQTVRLEPWDASTFNDTNGDGLGEFEGWGTSLCWWANRIG